MNSLRAPRLAWLPLPIFVRFFVALVLLTIIASALFGIMFGTYQERVTATTVAPLWADAIKHEDGADRAPPQSVVQRQATLAVHVGPPPVDAYSVLSDQRTQALVQALAQSGVSVTDVRLDDDSELPITWLRVQPSSGQARWVGFEGGLQPGLFRARTWRALTGLLILMAVAAWFISRWVAKPLAKLSRQLDEFGRGEVPLEPVRGSREIERFGAALATMARQRAAFEEQRRTMLMGVSHDLRSPLTRIRVAADLIDTQPALRELIVRNVEHADAIIDSFLVYVRTDAEPVDQPVDLGHIVASAARLVQLPPAQLSVASGVLVRGNATLLQRLVTNLLENALKHGAPPVAISVTRDGAQVLLQVTDRGPGISDPQRMMQPFERGDASRSKRGAGLGLAIVARIVERHGGRIAIDTPPQGGARVAVRLPAVD